MNVKLKRNVNGFGVWEGGGTGGVKLWIIVLVIPSYIIVTSNMTHDIFYTRHKIYSLRILAVFTK